MTLIRSAVTVIALASLAILPSVAGAAGNPLIGEWQLVGGEPTAGLGRHCPSRGIVFTPTTETIIDADTQLSAEVRYLDLAGKQAMVQQIFIAVIDTKSKTGDALLTYRILSDDRIERRDYIDCIFQRGDPIGRTQSQSPAESSAPRPHVTTYEDAQRAIQEMENPSQPHVMTYDEAIEAIGKMK